MQKIHMLERDLELEKLKKREKDLQIMKEDAEKTFVNLIIALEKIKTHQRELE